MSTATIQVSKIAGSLGAEVAGMDLAKPIVQEQFEERPQPK